MRRLFLYITILCLMLTCAFGEEEFLPPIRLHIVAESDEAEAQEMKKAVCGEIEKFVSGLLGEAENAEEAFRMLLDNLSAIEAFSGDVSKNAGYNGKVRAKAGIFSYPETEYLGKTYPAGLYRSLRIEMGKAEGKNWWCVIGPSFADYEEGGIRFYSSVYEWLSRLLNGGK